MREESSKENFNLNISRGDSSFIEEIIVCPLCKGTGIWGSHNGYLFYDKPIGDIKPEDTCDKCDGTGRLVMSSKIKFRPLDIKKSLTVQVTRNPENVI